MQQNTSLLLPQPDYLDKIYGKNSSRIAPLWAINTIQHIGCNKNRPAQTWLLIERVSLRFDGSRCTA